MGWDAMMGWDGMRMENDENDENDETHLGKLEMEIEVKMGNAWDAKMPGK